jgi:hypothetical protein
MGTQPAYRYSDLQDLSMRRPYQLTTEAIFILLDGEPHDLAVLDRMITKKY